MENVYYRKTLQEMKDSPDGESPTILFITKEVNGFALILVSYYCWEKVIDWSYNPNKLIEKAVGMSFEDAKLFFDEQPKEVQNASS